MSLEEVIDSIIQEIEYRSEEGVVDLKKESHLAILSEILDEVGLTEIKTELINNLIGEESEEKRFGDPTLDKTISYTDEDGKEAENKVGNLLRLDKDDPGRKAADKQVPKDPEKRKQVMNTLGGENQPTRDDSSTDTPSSEPEMGEDGIAEPEMGTAFKGEQGDDYRETLPKGDPAAEENDAEESEEDELT